MQVGFGSSWFAALPSFSDMMLLAKSERRGLLVIWEEVDLNDSAVDLSIFFVITIGSSDTDAAWTDFIAISVVAPPTAIAISTTIIGFV